VILRRFLARFSRRNFPDDDDKTRGKAIGIKG